MDQLDEAIAKRIERQERRKFMQTELESLLVKFADALPPAELDCVRERFNQEVRLSEIIEDAPKGTIRSFDHQRGFGLIASDGGDVVIFPSEALADIRPECIRAMQRVAIITTRIGVFGYVFAEELYLVTEAETSRDVENCRVTESP